MSKTTILHVHHTFLYIALTSVHDYDVKMPNYTFCGGRKQASTNFLSLTELGYGSSTPGVFAYILQSK